MSENKYKKMVIKIVLTVMIMGSLIIGFDKISLLLSYVYGVISPLLIGGLLAVILNIPVKFFEKKLFKPTDNPKKPIRILSIILSLLLIIALISSIILFIVPRVGETFSEITEKLPEFLDSAITFIKSKIKLKGEIGQMINGLHSKCTSWEDLVSYITSMINKEDSNGLFSSAFTFAKNIFGSIGSVFLGIVFSIYCLIHKEKISIFVEKFLETFLEKEKFLKVKHISKLIHSNFVDFLFGQCLECFAVATIFTVIATLFRFKCSLLIGIPMIFLALIPYVGNIITCTLGILFTFALETPERALMFGILFIAIQTLDSYFLYPKVVGIKVKMPPILIFSSVIIGNGLFGLVGIFVMIPIATTIYMLIQEKMKKKTDIETEIVDADISFLMEQNDTYKYLSEKSSIIVGEEEIIKL